MFLNTIYINIQRGRTCRDVDKENDISRYKNLVAMIIGEILRTSHFVGKRVAVCLKLTAVILEDLRHTFL